MAPRRLLLAIGLVTTIGCSWLLLKEVPVTDSGPKTSHSSDKILNDCCSTQWSCLRLVRSTDRHKHMKQIDLSHSIAIVANIGVIIGIVFLGIEIRGNTIATEATTAFN